MELRDSTGRQVVLAVRGLVRVLRDEHSGGLSSSAVAVLRRLSIDGAHRVTDLAKRESASQPAMTQLVRRLESAGLVGRTASPDDGRGVVVEITGEGRELLERRLAEQSEFLDAFVARLSPDDRSCLEAALPALARLAEAAAQRAG